MHSMIPTFLVLMFLGIGCVSNPVNQATSDNYDRMCAKAETQNDLNAAEQYCYRALVNVEWGNLGDELKSERLYNLARIKRRLSKFTEAESLLRQSLEIEEALSPEINIKKGRRLVELSVNLAALDEWEEGSVLIKRVVPIANQYSNKEREFIILVLNHYGKHFKKVGETEKGNDFIDKASRL